MVQDQLQTVRRLLASQQADNKRLAEQVANLNEAVDGLRQSFASSQSEPAAPPARNRAVRTRAHAMSAAHHRRGKARG
jgi:peptidoglycan hydrolase CwlO-like protein